MLTDTVVRMAFSLADAMGINFILLAMVVVGALFLLGAHMLSCSDSGRNIRKTHCSRYC